MRAGTTRHVEHLSNDAELGATPPALAIFESTAALLSTESQR